MKNQFSSFFLGMINHERRCENEVPCDMCVSGDIRAFHDKQI